MYFICDVWCWEDEYGRWRPYPLWMSIELSASFCNTSIEYTFQGKTYIVTKQTASTGQQRNSTTNYIRNVRRTNGIYNIMSQFRDILHIKPSWKNVKGYFNSSKAYPFVYNKFFETVSKSRWDIVYIFDITNDKFEQNYSKLKKPGKHRGKKKKLLWHGTSRKNIFGGILENNYDINFNVRYVYGKGTYFAKNAQLSKSYSVDHENKYMLLNKVYVGKCTTKYSDEHYKRDYDSIVDNINDPQIYSIPNSNHIVPKYLIKFRRKGFNKFNSIRSLILMMLLWIFFPFYTSLLYVYMICFCMVSAILISIWHSLLTIE